MAPKKFKKSHDPVVICSRCFGVGKPVVSCMKCRLACCAACLTAGDGEILDQNPSGDRVCLECRKPTEQPECIEIDSESDDEDKAESDSDVYMDTDTSSDEETAESDVSSVPVIRKNETCKEHGKPKKLYCKNCGKSLCKSCFELGHSGHHVDNLAILYEIRRKETQEKLDIMYQATKFLERQESVRCAKNRKMLENRLATVLAKMKNIYLEGKKCVSRLVSQKLKKMEETNNRTYLKQNEYIVLTMWLDMMEPDAYLNEADDIDEFCEQVMVECTDENFFPVSLDDVGCALSPSFKMSSFDLKDFKNRTRWSVCLKTDYGVDFKVVIKKQINISVVVRPRGNSEGDALPNQDNFEVLVVLPHWDYVQEVYATFPLCTKQAIISTVKCDTEGFPDSDELRIQVGVRPMNALIELKLLQHKHNELLNRGQESYFSTCYKMKKRNLYWGRQQSYNVVDYDDRLWNMSVKPREVHQNDPNIDVEINLRSGSATRCQFFVELLHNTDSEKNIRKDGVAHFNAGDSSGWQDIISKEALLNDEVGYVSNGWMRFRFGVLPRED